MKDLLYFVREPGSIPHTVLLLIDSSHSSEMKQIAPATDARANSDGN
jgi:hypothetical protein